MVPSIVVRSANGCSPRNEVESVFQPRRNQGGQMFKTVCLVLVLAGCSSSAESNQEGSAGSGGAATQGGSGGSTAAGTTSGAGGVSVSVGGSTTSGTGGASAGSPSGGTMAGYCIGPTCAVGGSPGATGGTGGSAASWKCRQATATCTCGLEEEPGESFGVKIASCDLPPLNCCELQSVSGRPIWCTCYSEDGATKCPPFGLDDFEQVANCPP
jgi:hypothetical protein